MRLNREIARWLREERTYSEPLVSSVKGKKSCPSYQNEIGATKFAIRLADGAIRFLGPEEENEFRNQIPTVRYFGNCVTSRCFYWLGSCQLGNKISQIALSEPEAGNNAKIISECLIKKTCRWRSENGLSACHGCTQVDYEVKYG